MKILIFGGTTEGRNLSRALAEAGGEVTVCVVSDYGARQQGDHPGIDVETGPRSREEMEELLRGKGLCVDATHPFAVEATANIREAAESAGVPRLRLLREDGAEESASVKPVKSREEAIREAKDLLSRTSGNILLTTGVRDLPVYAENLDPERLVARVLPSEESIRICKEAAIPDRQIIAIQGPFSAKLNQALIEEYGICALIPKESGRTGGFPEKLDACEAAGIPAIVIARPEDEGMTYEQVLKECLGRIEKESDSPDRRKA